MVSRSVLKLDKGKNADCLVTISPEQQHAFLYPNIEDSTFHHQPKAGGPPFSPEREICDILLLSFIQTKWNQLSTDFVGPPFFQERSIVSHAFL